MVCQLLQVPCSGALRIESGRAHFTLPAEAHSLVRNSMLGVRPRPVDALMSLALAAVRRHHEGLQTLAQGGEPLAVSPHGPHRRHGVRDLRHAGGNAVLHRQGLPARLGEALCAAAGIPDGRATRCADLKRCQRRALLLALTACVLDVTGHEGYAKARRGLSGPPA